MDNFGRPVSRPRPRPAQSVPPGVPPQVTPKPIPEPPAPQPKRQRWWLLGSLIGLGIVIILALIGAWAWYQVQLSPVDSNDTTRVVVTIESGTSPVGIATELKSKNVIRSETAFLWYTRFTQTQNQLQAGTYRLSPSESIPEVVGHLTNGSVDTFTITFLPGATLAQNRQVLIDAGYSIAEVDGALAAPYESPLFAGKPAGTDLEGYIYGETYQFGAGVSVSEILEHTFEIYLAVIEEHDLEAAYATQGLSLYQGITLASIVQREAVGGDEPGIAQVFLRRLSIGMPLGSDVTYQYIADKLGVERDINLDSPYNTRRYPGLPPGPIATPGERALIAVGSPSDTDYLYFLSGDDNVTYFSRTFEEHERNIVDHCQEKCQII